MKKLIVSAFIMFIACALFVAGCFLGGHEHSLIYIAPRQATCAQEGNIVHYSCSCGALFLDAEGKQSTTAEGVKIPKTDDHSVSFVAATSTTCTQEGNVAHYVCGICHGYFVDENAQTPLAQEEISIPKIPHVTTQQNDTLKHWDYCANCNQKMNEENHTFTNNVCTVCTYSRQEEFAFRKNFQGDGYILEGRGTMLGNELTVPATYNDLPVVGISANAFERDTLTKITLPVNMNYIGNGAFANCALLTDVDFGGVTEIQPNAFKGCISLTGTLNLSGIVRVQDSAFADCSGISAVQFDNSLNYLYETAFNGCPIQSFAVSGTGGAFTAESGILYNADKSAIELVPIALQGNITLAQNLKKIAASAFHSRVNLTGITATAITEVGDSAFYGCTALQTVCLPATVTKMGKTVFDGCVQMRQATLLADYAKQLPKDGLQKLTLNGGTYLENYALLGASNLTEISLPDTLTDMGRNVFDGCNAQIFTDFDNVRYVQNWAVGFYGQPTAISLRATAVGIADAAFENCSATQVTVPETVKHIAGSAFSGTIEQADIPVTALFGFPKSALRTLTLTGTGAIASSAFEGNNALTSLVIGDGVTAIGARAFRNCHSLVSVRIGNGVTTIGENAFYAVAARITWGNKPTIKTIGLNAFTCYYGVQFTIPDSVTRIEDNAFSSCNKLVEVINLSKLSITAGNIQNPGGIASNKDCTVLTSATGSKITYQDNAFAFYVDGATRKLMHYAGNQAQVVLPQDCNGNTYVVAKYAFYRKPNIEQVITTDGVTAIENYAMQSCSQLQAVVIGKNVVQIGQNAVNACVKFSAVYYAADETAWANVAVDDNNENLLSATLYYFSQQSPQTGKNAWHYAEDGKTPVIWA